MSNLGEGIVEKTEEKIILRMRSEGYAFEQIAEIFETSSDSIKEVIEHKMA